MSSMTISNLIYNMTSFELYKWKIVLCEILQMIALLYLAVFLIYYLSSYDFFRSSPFCGSSLMDYMTHLDCKSVIKSFRRKHKYRLCIIIIVSISLLLIPLTSITTLLVAKYKMSNQDICVTPACLRSAASLATSMYTLADPCDNFYEYVCGYWWRDHPKPDASKSYDWFRDKQTKTFALVQDFLSKNISSCPKPVQQAQDMFYACTDTEMLNELGLLPIDDILITLKLPSYPTYIDEADNIEASTYTFDWLDVVIKAKITLGMDVLIGFDLFTDPVNSSIFRLFMGTPETTNPFPSMYVDKKRFSGKSYPIPPTFVKKPRKTSADPFFFENSYRQEVEITKDGTMDTDKIFRTFYENLFNIFVPQFGPSEGHINDSKIDHDNNIKLAAVEYVELYHIFLEMELDNETTSNGMWDTKVPSYTVDELQAISDANVKLNNGTAVPLWKRYLEGVFAVSDVTLDFEKDTIMISDADLRYLSSLAAFMAKTPPVTIELYIWVKVVEVMAVHATEELVKLFLETYDKLNVKGKIELITIRYQQCASAVNNLMGMAVAYTIIDPEFILETRPKIETMLNELKNSFARLVGRAKWMDDSTKLATYEKIDRMKSLIGFPDWLLEDGKLEEYYSGIEIEGQSHLHNMISIIQQKLKKGLNRFRTFNNYTWASSPTEVNAYHTFQENTITVPLVMLQQPFYDLGLDVLNYGSLGAVLGHEMTHGFDDFGRHFDKNGNILPWWSNSTIAAFEDLTNCFINQYKHFYVAELDQYIDGTKTLGENIADNGGMREAYFAFKEHERKHGPEPKLPGFEDFSPDQLFFISYTNLWCTTDTLDSLKQDLNDVHSPQRLRAIGALQNSEEFARAFQCPPGEFMTPRKRCIIF